MWQLRDVATLVRYDEAVILIADARTGGTGRKLIKLSHLEMLIVVSEFGCQVAFRVPS